MKITKVASIEAVSFDDLEVGRVYCSDHDVGQYMLVASEGFNSRNEIRMVVLKTGTIFNQCDFSAEDLFWPVKYKFEVY